MSTVVAKGSEVGQETVTARVNSSANAQISRFYRLKGHKRAEIILKRTLDLMGHSQQKAVLTIRQTLLSWRREILNYFKTGLTNARTEGVNLIAKLVQRQAFGYKSFRNYRLRLLYAYS